MFIRAPTLILAIAASGVAVLGGGVTSSQCDNGSLQCCDVSDPTGLIANCIPIISTAECKQQAFCCSDNNYNGLVNVGCSPISVLS